MTSGFDSGTWHTLLGRLQRDPTNPQAWASFVDHYGPRIYRWCRRWGLQEADAQDVTQDVLLRLATRLRDFAYDPRRSFRGWLRTLTHNAWHDHLENRRRPGQGSGDSQVQQQLYSAEAREDLLRQLDEEFDRELLEEAMHRVQVRVEARTWNAFRLLAIEGRTGAEVAGQLEMKVATVFVARSKVQRMLREEVRRLEASASPDDALSAADGQEPRK